MLKDEPEVGQQIIRLEDSDSYTTISAEELTPQERAKFSLAKWVLMVIAIILVFGIALRYYATGEDQIQAAIAIFDFLSTGAPPIVTLILGYYFGAERQGAG